MQKTEIIPNGASGANVLSLVGLESSRVQEHVPIRPQLAQEKVAVVWDQTLSPKSV